MTHLRLVGTIVAVFFLLSFIVASLQKRRKQPTVRPQIGDIDYIEENNDSLVSTKRVIHSDRDNYDEHLIDNSVSSDYSTAPINDNNAIKDEIFVINVLAEPNHQFAGYELLQSLLAADLRYGEMNIFHRYSQLNDQGEIIFSVASATEPGIFDINQMGGFTCKGLSLFLRLSNTKKDIEATKLMYATAKQLAQDLGGGLHDKNYRVMTENELVDYLNLLQH